MIIEPTESGTWIAHGRANGTPFVAEAETREDAFHAALDTIYQAAALREAKRLEGEQ